MSLPGSKTYGVVDETRDKNMLLIKLHNPEKDMLKSSPPVPHKVKVLEIRPMCMELVKSNEVILDEGGILIRIRSWEEMHKGRMPCVNESKDWTYTAVNQRTLKTDYKPSEAKKMQGRYSLTDFRGNMPWQQLDFRLLFSRMAVQSISVVFNPFGFVVYFIMVSLRN